MTFADGPETPGVVLLLALLPSLPLSCRSLSVRDAVERDPPDGFVCSAFGCCDRDRCGLLLAMLAPPPFWKLPCDGDLRGVGAER